MSSTKNLNTLKATFEVCKDPMALVNSQEEITLFNSAFVELFNLPSTREQYSIQNIKHSLFLKKETLIENPYALFKSLSKTNSQEAGVYVQIKKDFTFFLLKSVEIQDPETADSEYLITFQQNNTLDNHHYLDVLESSPAGTWLWDISSGKVTWWGNIEEMFGLKKGEFDGTYEHFKALIYKEDLPEVEKSIAQSLKTGNNYSAIHRVQLKNKEIRWLQENGRIIKGTDGKPEKIAGFVTDITIQKQLQDDRNRYDSFVKYSTGCKFITDLDGKIIFVNDFCRYLLGIQGDSIHGESLELLIAEEYQKNYINIILPAILKDGKWNGELSIQHQTEKTTIPVIFDSFLIFNEKNKPYNIGFSAKDISREVELRKNLLSSQALFESIFKNSIDVILTIDRNFIVNTINRPLGQFSTNEINNNLVLDFLPQDQKDNIKQYLKDCFQSGTLKSFDFEYKLKSNTLIYAATIIPMQKNNQIDSLMIVLRDQTQQKIREIELSKATNAIESSMDAIFSSDLEGLITYANPAAAEKWGYRNVSEMLAERPYVFNYWKEESLPLAQEIMQTLGEEGKYEGEGQLVATKKNGEEFVVRIRSRLIQDKNGNPIGMTGSFHNLSELIKINQELSIKEHELKEAQRIAKIGSWELDLVNNVLHWSDEIYRLLGLEPQSINANFETFLGYIHPDEREIVANAYTSHVEHKTEYDIIHRLISEDKKVYYIHERCETLYDDEGTPLRSLGTAADVTELKEIQIELELLKENLEKIVTERTSELEQINEELEVANSELVSIHTSIIKQEEKYRILAENSGDAVSSYDANLNCTYVSPAIQRITGYTPQESLALSLKDIVHPLDYEKVYLSFQKGLKREENKTTTRYRRKNKDGTFSWMESLATYNFTANNQLENIIVNERDISSQIHIENELRESEERFRGIFENAGTGVVFGDEQGNTILVNEAFENIIGYSHDELYKLNFRDFTFDDDLPEEEQYMREIFENKRDSYEIEKRYKKKDKRPIWVNLYVSTIRDKSGHPKYFVGIINNISDRKYAEELLIESEEKYRFITENTSDVIINLNQNSVVLFASLSIKDVLGYEVSDWLGKQFIDENIIDKNDIKLVKQQFKDVNTGKQVLFEFKAKHKNKQTLWCEMLIKPLMDETNQYISSIASIRDITSRKQMLRELEEKNEKLKQTQSQLLVNEKMASLGGLMAGIAHEINNPMNFIHGGVEALKENVTDFSEIFKELNEFKGKTSDEVLNRILDIKNGKQLDKRLLLFKKIIGNIENGVSRTLEIIRGLQIFTRSKENEIAQVDIHENIDATLVVLHNTYKSVAKITKYYGEIPQVECNPGKLNQVFSNLIINAVHAIEEKYHGSNTGTIFIETNYAEGNITIKIGDDGIGISDEIKKSIFEPFFTTKPMGKGTGLGLSLTFSIIQDHYGKIEVKKERKVINNKSDLYTILEITLPIKQAKK